MVKVTTPNVDDLDTVLAGIRARQQEAIAAQRRKRIIRVMRVFIVAGIAVAVVAAFVLGVTLTSWSLWLK